MVEMKLENMLIEEGKKLNAANKWWSKLSWKSKIEIHNELKGVY